MPDADLIKTICNGPDPARKQAWLELDYAFRPKLFRLLVPYLKSEAEVEDCLQEVFLKVFRDACKFRGSSGIWTWLRKLAHSTAIDHLRKKQRAPDITSISAKAEEEASFDRDLPEFSLLPENLDHETLALADEAFREFERLYPDEAMLLKMRTLEEVSVAEIAEILGVSIDATKVRLFRTRLKFKKLFLERLQGQG